MLYKLSTRSTNILYMFRTITIALVLTLPQVISAQDNLLLTNNEIRHKFGLQPHTTDKRLENAAKLHAEYLAATDNFTHRPIINGYEIGPGQRAWESGYYGRVYENISKGYSNDEVYTAWQNSKPHLEAILSDTVHIGIAKSTSKLTGVEYYVIVYGQPQPFMLIKCLNLHQKKL